MCPVSKAKGIAGGRHAAALQFPYQVSIQVDNTNGCGAGIIADDLILTAAHCFINNYNLFKLLDFWIVARVVSAKERGDSAIMA